MLAFTTTKAWLRLLLVGVLGGCAGVNIAVALWAVQVLPALNNDFRGLWSFAGFARNHAAEIYQAAPLQAFQQAIYPGFRSFFPYLYPPDFLLAIGWLGDCRFAVAQMLWMVAGIAALVFAALVFFPREKRWMAMAVLLASPACLLNGVAGETGYFTTALLLGGFAALPARPWVAGICFGLLTLKPQLGLLIPLALLARGNWEAIAAACLTALGLVGLCCAFYPAGLWGDWLRSLPLYQAQYLAAGGELDLHEIVSIAGNLIAAGANPRIAWGLQALGSMGSAAAVFCSFRHGPYHLAVAAVFVGMFLCAPHAYAYDTLPLVAAMLVWAPESVAGVVVCGVTYLAPLLLLSGAAGWFIYAIPETLVFGAIIYLAIGPGRRPNTGYEPVS